MRLIHMTDSHIFADVDGRLGGIETRRSFDAVLAAVTAGSEFDLLVLGGDNSMDGTVASCRWLSGRLDAIVPAVMMVAGNHDEPSAWPRHSDVEFDDAPRVFDHPAWSVIGMSTRVHEHAGGCLDDSDLQALDSLLDQRRDQHVLIAMHHPPVKVGSAWIDAIGLERSDQFWSVLRRHRHVRAIVSGHVHQNFDTWHHGVRVMTTPSTCAQFARRAATFALDRQAPGYRIIDLHDDGEVETRVMRVLL